MPRSRTNSADENSRQIGSCGYFANPSGRYLFSIDTNISPGTPLLFESILLVNTEVEPRTAQLTLIPLTVGDRYPIEDLPDRDGDSTIVTPTVSIDDEGKFELSLGRMIVPGVANPISGSELEMELTLRGQILTRSFICGTVEGNLIRY